MLIWNNSSRTLEYLTNVSKVEDTLPNVYSGIAINTAPGYLII
jgi:hypothetical protein